MTCWPRLWDRLRTSSFDRWGLTGCRVERVDDCAAHIGLENFLGGKVTGRVVALDRALEDALPYLFGLLGLVEGDDPLAQMDGQVKKRRTLEAIKRILLRETLNQPLMVIFEDLHWIDQQAQEFLNLLADSIGTAKILLHALKRLIIEKTEGAPFFMEETVQVLFDDGALVPDLSPCLATHITPVWRTRPA